MQPVFDVHAHILPGIDDGAADWEESRQMLRCAYSQGIRTMIATPHYSRRQDVERLRELAGRLDREAKEIASDFCIFLGQEILYFNSLAEELRKGQALTMAGSRCVLIEFMPDMIFSNMYKAVRSLTVAGYYPIIAHVERYTALRSQNNMDELAGAGCFMQMNYRSLQGGLFNKRAVWCRRQVLEGNIHLLGTDAHHINGRTPEIAKSLDWLNRHVGEAWIAKITRDNASRIILQGYEKTSCGDTK